MFSSTTSKSFKPSSRSQKHTTSAVRDGRMSFDSDTSTLLSVNLPLSAAKTLPKYDHVEVEMIDEEDQAWGPPPSSGYKWSMPKFSRKSRS